MSQDSAGAVVRLDDESRLEVEAYIRITPIEIGPNAGCWSWEISVPATKLDSYRWLKRNGICLTEWQAGMKAHSQLAKYRRVVAEQAA